MTKRLLKASLSAETTLMFPAGRRPAWERLPCPAKKSVPIRHLPIFKQGRVLSQGYLWENSMEVIRLICAHLRLRRKWALRLERFFRV